jgi:DNA-binding NarL/FixJ family response regulator
LDLLKVAESMTRSTWTATRRKGALALIVAEPGPLRDSLRAFLMTLPQIDMVDLVDDSSSALALLRERDPDLLLVDANQAAIESLLARRTIKADGTTRRCLVLADDKQQQQAAILAGADVVLIKGYPAAKLFKTIEELLSQDPPGRRKEP